MKRAGVITAVIGAIGLEVCAAFDTWQVNHSNLGVVSFVALCLVVNGIVVACAPKLK